ncbi:oxidoreductase domain-containing protein [Flammeovirgaceae bacterium 311]|nr:oxidoreductase domain-containing protein [Flammeovirgaceae bacterium 311]
MKSNRFSRRHFLLTGAAAASGLAAFGLSASPAMDFVAARTDTLRIGIIGTGGRGEGIAMLLKEIPDVALVACCDLIPERLQKVMKHAARGAKAFIDYRKLLEEKNIDAVVVATPLHLHHQMGVDALEAGKHVYMEKTMTYDIPQSIDLVRRVRNSGLVFHVGHQYRSFPFYHKVYEAVTKGWCGEITHIESQYNRNSSWRRGVSDPAMERLINWRLYREYSGGLMAELCSHQIDIANWILGSPPTKVTGFGGIDYWKDGRDIFDNVRTLYEYPNGVKSSVTSILTNAYQGVSMRILGTKATLEIQDDQALLIPEHTKVEHGTVDGFTGATKKSWAPGEATPIAVASEEGPKDSPTYYAFVEFFDCIRNNKQPASNVETGNTTAIAVHMGNMAMRNEKVQYWKPEYSL